MRRSPLVVVLSVVAVTGCAAVALTSGPDPREQLAQGMAAIETQEFARARSLLEPLYYQHWSEPVGQQALLGLIAAELDGRNPERRLWAASDMAGRLLRIPQLEPWMIPVGETFYLLAEELGASAERIAFAEAARADAEARADHGDGIDGSGRALPASTRETVQARMTRMTNKVQALEAQLEERNQQIAVRDRELRETKQELERIKKIIRS